jgi:hypothetical protein
VPLLVAGEVDERRCSFASSTWSVVPAATLLTLGLVVRAGPERGLLRVRTQAAGRAAGCWLRRRSAPRRRRVQRAERGDVSATAEAGRRGRCVGLTSHEMPQVPLRVRGPGSGASMAPARG